MSLFAELNRRNVTRVGIAFAVAGWLVTEVASVVLPTFGAPEWVLKVLIALLMIGFPVTLLFAWVYEITPEGIKREQDVDRSNSITTATSKKLDVVTILLVVVGIGFLATDRFGQEKGGTDSISDTVTPAVAVAPTSAVEIAQGKPAATVDGNSIAVLPFVNMSADADNEYFSDGLSETLLHMLAQVKGLHVAARTSSFAFKGKNMDVAEIGKTLKVATVLEGSVQKSGDRLRITAQLIDASAGNHIWSQSFDRTLDDVFAIQDEIATEVVAALKVSLLGEDSARLVRKRTASVAAYQEYLLGIGLLPRRLTEELQQAIGHFSRAIELDPDYAAAYAQYAIAYELLEEYGYVAPEDKERADRYLDKALELDPQLGEAQAALGDRLRDEGKYEAAEKAFDRAAELAPSFASTYHWKGHMYRTQLARYDEAIQTNRIAFELDPLSPVIHANFAFSLLAGGRFQDAEREFDQLLEREPDSLLANWGRAQPAWRERGDLVTAKRYLDAAARSDSGAIGFALSSCELLLDFRLPDLASDCIDRIALRGPEHPRLVQARAQLAIYRQDLPDGIPGLQQAPDIGAARTSEWLHTWYWGFLFGAEEALLKWRQLEPRYFDPASSLPPVGSSRGVAVEIAVGGALIKTGQEILGRAVLEAELQRMRQRDRIRGWDSYQWSDVAAYAALGNRTLALAALKEAVDAGLVFRSWALPFWLGAYADDEEFAVVLQKLEANIARQRRQAEAEGLL